MTGTVCHCALCGAAVQTTVNWGKACAASNNLFIASQRRRLLERWRPRAPVRRETWQRSHRRSTQTNAQAPGHRRGRSKRRELRALAQLRQRLDSTQPGDAHAPLDLKQSASETAIEAPPPTMREGDEMAALERPARERPFFFWAPWGATPGTQWCARPSELNSSMA